MKQNIFKVLILFFLSLLFKNQLAAQDIPLIHLTVDDGLPSNNVYQIYRDSKGFLWFATDKGIARYNGITFERFTTFNGLPDNEIFSFREDSQYRLWMATFNGEFCYYENGIFHVADNTPLLNIKTIATHIAGITLEKDNSVTFRFNDMLHFANLSNNVIKAFYLNKINDTIGIAGLIHIRKVNPNKYELMYTDRKVFIDTLQNITSIEKYKQKNKYGYTSSNGDEYLLSRNGVYTLSEELLFKTNHEINISYYNVAMWDKNNAFLSLPDGLYINNDLQLLKGERITSCIKDVRNNYWIGTLNKGAYCMSNNFQSTSIAYNQYTARITGVKKDNNTISALTNEHKALIISGHATKVLKTLSPLQECIWKLPHNNLVTDNIKSNAKLGIAIDHAWNKYVRELFYDSNYLYALAIPSITYIKYRENPEKAYDLLFPATTAKKLENRILCWAKDKYGIYWFSTNHAVYKIVNGHALLQPGYDGHTFRLFVFQGDFMVAKDNKNEVLIYKLKRDGSILWANTLRQNCIWEKFYTIGTDQILISTDNLYRVLTLDSTAKISVLENEFFPLQADYIFSNNNTIYVFKEGNIHLFTDNILQEKSSPPKIYFTTLKTNYDTYPIDTVEVLSYKKSRNISIAFNAVSFYSKYITYQYSISDDGVEKWHEVDGDNINLANLGYGNYQIKVRCKTLASSYSVPAVMSLVIKTPFWATWWFIVLSGLLLILSGFFAVRSILRFQLKSKQKLYENELKYVRSEFKALNAMMNPHFVFNSLSSIRGLINGNDRKAANNFVVIFSRLIRQNMQNISKELISLTEEILLVENYLKLEKLRFHELINYEIIKQADLYIDEILIPPLMIQPLVENAVNHGLLPLQSDGAKLTITISEKAGGIRIEIRDNGIGIDFSRNGKIITHESYGLENLVKRLKHMNLVYNQKIEFTINQIVDDQNKIQGTVAVLEING